MSTPSVEHKIRSLLLQARDAYDEHCKKWNCTTDSNGCLERIRFQARIEALEAVVKLLRDGGKR